MIKACIFDMDGTTVNTIDSIAYFGNNALKKQGLEPIDTEDYKYLVGNGAAILVERMIEKSGGTKEDYDAVFKEYNTTYDNDFLYLTRPYDGICEMLEALKEKGIKIAILSNKPHTTAVKVSDALFGDSLIDVCYGGRTEIPLKPSPEGVFEIMNELSVSSEECLYIGDTSTDMLTGKNSGLFTVGVLWGFRKREELEEAGADAIISAPMELLDYVK